MKDDFSKKGKTVLKSFITTLYENPMTGAEIERRSFNIIDSEAPSHSFDAQQWTVVRRMIHTVADFSIMEHVRFSGDAISSAIKALKGCNTIYADSNMIKAGLSIARLKQVCEGYSSEKVITHIADSDIAEEAKSEGLPRSLFAVRKAKSLLNGAIVVFGNAPVGLLELNRLVLEEGIKPACVIAMPVGFVHVKESKKECMECGIPFIALEGRRGGSPLAVSALHAICSVAIEK